jgi:nitrate reductase gamma subunit
MMHDIYYIVSGPMVWISMVLFAAGSLYRVFSMGLLAAKKDHVVISYMNIRYALRSILHWIIPYASISMRRRPVMTAVAFSFHICLILTPIFLLAHVLLIKESWNISWWYLPDRIADAMTLTVIAGCIFFLIRRTIRPEVRYLTDASDYFLLALVAAPFASGFWAAQHWPGYNLALVIHILSGEVLLASIPFTRFSHMLFFPFTRGYMGSEFGGVRKAKDW